jgi:MFS family permease
MAFSVLESTQRVARNYAAQVRAFKPNARLYLVNVVIAGAAMGVFRLLFNFYVLSLGFDQALLGNLITASSLTALLAALPMGYLADVIGRKRSLLISAGLVSASILAMVIWPFAWMFLAMNVVSGLAQSLAAVSMAPFLMENSDERERTYLFSFSSGLQMAMASVGNWVGGYLPGWAAAAKNVSPTSSGAYAGALWVIAVVYIASMLPLVFLRSSGRRGVDSSIFAPLSYARHQPVLLGKLILPMLVTSIGAGLIMPFMNVFFRVVYHQPDPVIGGLFAWGSLAMGLGLLAAPPLAERMGKIQLVVITQGLSIPFLILLGFAPWFWVSAAAYYIRVALMNMSGPVYQTFVMEHVEPESRAMVASLVSMAWNFGWAFTPTISGWMQVQYGFGLPFLGTIIMYIISVGLYWGFFWHKRKQPLAAAMPGVGV